MKTLPKRGATSLLAGLYASNQATLSLLLILAACIVVYYQITIPGRIWIVVVPTCLLILNFFCALYYRQILKNNWLLMSFHFALIALVLLVFLGQMTYLRATLELAENEEFNGQLENVESGPWHRYGLAESRFTNLGFQIRYNEGIKRAETLNQLELILKDGSRQQIEIGDHVPLIIGHYRFYTSHNKGYAPVFDWIPSGSNQAIRGSIHLPAYPAHEFRQALEWQPPGSNIKLWTMLQLHEEVLPSDRDFFFKVPEQHQLVVRYGDNRQALEPGDEIKLDSGVLRYQKLGTWMGYKVDYDWTRPWLLSTCMIGILGLFSHFIKKFLLHRPTGNGRSD